MNYGPNLCLIDKTIADYRFPIGLSISTQKKQLLEIVRLLIDSPIEIIDFGSNIKALKWLLHNTEIDHKGKKIACDFLTDQNNLEIQNTISKIDILNVNITQIQNEKLPAWVKKKKIRYFGDFDWQKVKKLNLLPLLRKQDKLIVTVNKIQYWEIPKALKNLKENLPLENIELNVNDVQCTEFLLLSSVQEGYYNFNCSFISNFGAFPSEMVINIFNDKLSKENKYSLRELKMRLSGYQCSNLIFDNKSLMSLKDLIIKPIKNEGKLKYHKQGPGQRYEFMNKNVFPFANQYFIIREIKPSNNVQQYVETHKHCVDNINVFLGNNTDLTGLKIEFELDDQIFKLDSPISIFVPAGVPHTFRILSGSGHYLNHLQSGSYQDGLLEEFNS